MRFFRLHLSSNEPFLISAFRYQGKIYKGKQGEQHSDIIARAFPSKNMYEIDQMREMGEILFINQKGQIFNRSNKALEFAMENNLIDPAWESTCSSQRDGFGLCSEYLKKGN